MLPAFTNWPADAWRQLVTFPLGGPVEQDIAPQWFPTTIHVSGQGDPELERRIVGEVATYGKQLGELTDVVLAIVREIGLESSPALASLEEISAAVEQKKLEYYKPVAERARRTLDELASTDPEELARLLERYRVTDDAGA